MSAKKAALPVDHVESRILLIRGKKVMLDRDLAELYGVTTKRLNEQVRRNRHRFPRDFMFQIAAQDVAALRSQFATSKESRGGRRTRPYAFTEHGPVMLASVLNTPAAVEISVLVVRAFVRMRRVLARHEELADKLSKLEEKVASHDHAIRSLIRAIRNLIGDPPAKRSERIGFLVKERASDK
jgi:hypothetical protein